MSYLLVLFAGYRYGAAVGAMAGAVGGILSVAGGSDMILIGVYCVLGITVGIFREIGRIVSAITFVAAGIVFAYVIRDEVLGIVELRGMVSAGIVFLAVPRELVRTIETDFMRERENPFAKADLMSLANEKIDGFSTAFLRLAKSFRDFTKCENHISGEEMELIFDELADKICRECENCKYCWEMHYEETYDNIRNILAAASEQGVVECGQVDASFLNRCIHLEEYAEKLNERMALARMNLSWRNKMAESREAMASQMYEIAYALRGFTQELNQTVDVPEETKKKVLVCASLARHTGQKSFLSKRCKKQSGSVFSGESAGKCLHYEKRCRTCAGIRAFDEDDSGALCEKCDFQRIRSDNVCAGREF